MEQNTKEILPHLSRKNFFPMIYKFELPKIIGEWELYTRPTYLVVSTGLHSEYIYAEYERIDRSSETLVPFYFDIPGSGWRFKCLKNGIYYFIRKGKRT